VSGQPHTSFGRACLFALAFVIGLRAGFVRRLHADDARAAMTLRPRH
jgi:hypothetical protein